MSYAEKLKNPKWQKKRLEILQRDEFKCCYCNDEKTELQIHHLKYTKEPWQAPNEDLITLCKHCHNLISVYKGLYIINIEKNYYENEDIYCLIVKHTSNNKVYITAYDYHNNSLSEVCSFLVGGQYHKSILKLTA